MFTSSGFNYSRRLGLLLNELYKLISLFLGQRESTNAVLWLGKAFT